MKALLPGSRRGDRGRGSVRAQAAEGSLPSFICEQTIIVGLGQPAWWQSIKSSRSLQITSSSNTAVSIITTIKAAASLRPRAAQARFLSSSERYDCNPIGRGLPIEQERLRAGAKVFA